MEEKTEDVIEVQEEANTDDEKKWCVYCHTNKINGKKYFGITCQKPEERWKNGNAYKTQTVFWRAISKYTWDGFVHEVIADNLTKNKAKQKEIELISLYKTNCFRYTNPSYGYNCTDGGDMSYIPSEETRRKYSDARKGVPLSEKTKQTMSKNRKGSGNAFYGKHHTEESKRKISESRKGVPVTPEWRQKIIDGQDVKRAVYCVELNVLYKGPSEAGTANNINYRHISECCKEKPHRKTAGGYHWVYADNAVKQGYIKQQQLDNFLKQFKTERK